MNYQYFYIENYCMKCRLYPNKSQKIELDKNFHAAHVCYNNMGYLLRLLDPEIVIEKTDVNNPDEVVHWPNYANMMKKSFLDRLRLDSPIIDRLPASALASNVYGIVMDIKKSCGQSTKNKCVNSNRKPMPIEKWGMKYKGNDGNNYVVGHHYYTKKNPRRSYSFQMSANNVVSTDNHNVYRVSLKSRSSIFKNEYGKYLTYDIDNIKCRGVNENIRFDEALSIDFSKYIKQKNNRFTVTIEKDNCENYYIVFLLNGIYKPIPVSEKKESIGIDAGEISLATLSNGKKYTNVFDANTRMMRDKDAIDRINRKLGNSWGYKNPRFLDKYKKDKTIRPSKRYFRLNNKVNQYHKDNSNRRTNYYNVVTNEILANADMIGIESLKVRNMFIRKVKSSDKQEKKKT